MILYPAIDLMGGAVVRLKQGRFDEATRYGSEPADALAAFAAAGAQWAHVVDLDGARNGQPVQHEGIAALARAAPIRLQVAGGFRHRDQAARMLDAGAARIVVGSLAVREPDTVREWIGEFGPERVAIALDIRMAGAMPMVAVLGWAEDGGQSLWDAAAALPAARHLILTDIDRDGMLRGPNFNLYERAADELPHLRIQASGGISSLDDLERLSTDGAIVGRALWEGQVRLEEALAGARA